LPSTIVLSLRAVSSSARQDFQGEPWPGPGALGQEPSRVRGGPRHGVSAFG